MRVNLWDYPPYPYLEQVLNHCNEAGSTYLSLWKDRNKDNCVSIEKAEIRTRFLCSRHLFHNNLLKLVKEGLISVDETADKITVHLVDWEYDEIEE